jgi:hypothetical protein
VSARYQNDVMHVVPKEMKTIDAIRQIPYGDHGAIPFDCTRGFHIKTEQPGQVPIHRGKEKAAAR